MLLLVHKQTFLPLSYSPEGINCSVAQGVMLCILSNNNWALENLALCSPGSMSQGSLEGKIAVTSDSVSSGVLAATFPALAQRLREGCSRGQARAWLPSACGSPALSRPLHTLLSFLRSNSAGQELCLPR